MRVTVARSYPDGVLVRVVLHCVDVANGSGRKLKGGPPGLAPVRAHPDTDGMCPGRFCGVFAEID